MFEENHRFKKAVGHGTGTCPASSNGYPPLGKKSGGYALTFSLTSFEAATEKIPVLGYCVQVKDDHSKEAIYTHYPCNHNTYDNDIFVCNLTIKAVSTCSSDIDYTFHKNYFSELTPTTNNHIIKGQPGYSRDYREHVKESLLPTVNSREGSEYNNVREGSPFYYSSQISKKPILDPPRIFSPQYSFSQNKQSSYFFTFQLSLMDCSSCNSNTDD